MKYTTLPKEELSKFKKRMPESEVMAEYKKYIEDLPDDKIGHFAVDDKDSVKPNTIKARLRKASDKLKVDIQVERHGNEIIFYHGSKTTKKPTKKQAK